MKELIAAILYPLALFGDFWLVCYVVSFIGAWLHYRSFNKALTEWVEHIYPKNCDTAFQPIMMASIRVFIILAITYHLTAFSLS